MAHLEGAFVQLDKRLGDLASNIDARFGQVDRRFDSLERRIDGLDKRFNGLQWRLTALIVGTWTTTMLAVVLHH